MTAATLAFMYGLKIAALAALKIAENFSPAVLLVVTIAVLATQARRSA